MTPKEAGELCILTGILGKNRDIFCPKLSEKINLITFSEIATRYIIEKGFEPYECSNESEARDRV